MSLFNSFEFNLVVYDEIENFQDYDSLLFNYPYKQRKNVIETIDFSANVSVDNYAYYH